MNNSTKVLLLLQNRESIQSESRKEPLKGPYNILDITELMVTSYMLSPQLPFGSHEMNEKRNGGLSLVALNINELKDWLQF